MEALDDRQLLDAGPIDRLEKTFRWTVAVVIMQFEASEIGQLLRIGETDLRKRIFVLVNKAYQA